MQCDFGTDDVPLLMVLPPLNKLVLSSAKLKQYSFGKSSFIILTALSMRGSLYMSQIADYLNSSKEQATRAVEKLADEGYVDRYTLPDNRTHVYVRLTEAGEAFVKKCRAEFHKNVNEKLDANVSSEEKEALQQAACTIIRILGKIR